MTSYVMAILICGPVLCVGQQVPIESYRACTDSIPDMILIWKRPDNFVRVECARVVAEAKP